MLLFYLKVRRPSTLAKLSKQAGFPWSRLEHRTRSELSNRLARFGCIQPWYLQYTAQKWSYKRKNDAKCTKDWHLPAHDLTFPPILPRNQRCYGLIGQHLAPAHFGNLDAFKAGIHLTKAINLEPEAHEAPRVWQQRKWCEAHFLGPGSQHCKVVSDSFALRQLHGSKASKTAASASRAPLRGAIILGAIVASERHDVQKNEPQQCAEKFMYRRHATALRMQIRADFLSHLV